MSLSNRKTSQIVAEIYQDLGVAFTRLGELEILLNPDSESRQKFSDADIAAFKAAIIKFGGEIDKICQRIKDRTLQQIRKSMTRHAYEEAGIPMRKQQVVATAIKTEKVNNASSVMSPSNSKSADITLNMLNATEQEVDVEGLGASDKLDYDCNDGS